MVIDGPMSEDGVWVLRFEDVLKRAIVVIVEDSVAVDLVGVGGPRLRLAQQKRRKAKRTL